ncbi:MAG: sugar phosphate nucleotidyltransferase, partial [Patescibacteria group bacterium]
MTEPARHGLSGITAAILAGGLGTRLRSVLADKPKVLAEIYGRPFLSYLLDQLNDAGVRRVVLLIGYRGDEIRNVFGDYYKNLKIRYSEESSPLGTGGAVRLALPILDSDPAFIMNGDSFCDADIM